jgi:hypothetical protein
MSPKLLLTYPHREEDRGIAMASLFLRLMLLKVLPNQLKIFVNLTFFTKSLTILFVLIYSELRVPALWIQQKRSKILVLLWQKVYYLWLKKSVTKINAFLVISELMASFGKVLRCFGDIGKKITGTKSSLFEYMYCAVSLASWQLYF